MDVICMSYKGVSLPEKLVDDVDDIVKSGKGGYSSRSEFFKDAARTLIKKLKNQ